MKPSHRMQEIVVALAQKHSFDLTLRGTHLRLTMPYFDPLVIEVLHEHLVYVAHVYEPRPDVHIGDPGIAFFSGYDLWVPIEVSQRIGGHRVYAALSNDLNDIVTVCQAEQANLAGFAEIWAANIVGQGWLAEGIRDDEESIPF